MKVYVKKLGRRVRYYIVKNCYAMDYSAATHKFRICNLDEINYEIRQKKLQEISTREKIYNTIVSEMKDLFRPKKKVRNYPNHHGLNGYSHQQQMVVY